MLNADHFFENKIEAFCIDEVAHNYHFLLDRKMLLDGELILSERS